MQDNDISKQLSKLLEDPEALARAMSLAQSLMGNTVPNGGTSENEGSEKREDSDEKPAEDKQDGAQTPDLGAALPAIAGILGKSNKKDPRCDLLYALKPYMSHERAEKIDTLVKIMRLAELAGGFLDSGGIF